MASNYPTSIDSFNDPLSNSPLNNPSHAGQHQDLNDAVEKLETKLGVTASPAASASAGHVLTATGSGSTWQVPAVTAAQFANVGLVYVTHTTVGSGVTSVTINNCFTSTYDNYRVTLTNIDCTTNGDVMAMQLTTSGTPSAANYAGNTFYVSTGATGGLTNAALSAYFEVLSISNTSTASGSFDVYQPAIAQWTRLHFGPTVDDTYFRFGGGVHKVTTAYDGMKLSAVVGSMTGGTITVYGYKKG